MSYPKYIMLILPYTRLELPGWGGLLKLAGAIDNDELWQGAPSKTIRGKWHNYIMTLDLANWSERLTYFLGRFYDLPTQLFIKETVKKGDSFIDIGANIGMITLLAARCVGARGTVVAFEPNPLAAKRLKTVAIANQLKQVTIHQCGLADREDKLTLNVATKHTGTGTFGELSQQDLSSDSQRYEVPVYRGDTMLGDRLTGVTFIKIDVEGFEPYVLKGLSKTIANLQPVILTEVVEEHLKRAGSSIEKLFAIMQAYGYEAFDLKTQKSFWHHSLQLNRVKTRPETDNIVWLPKNEKILSKFKPWLTA
jgi:FkbM family methyltransferase